MRRSEMKRLVKTLRFIQHTVGAVYATVELGDAPPLRVEAAKAGSDGTDLGNRFLVHELGPGARLILQFAEPVSEKNREKLGLLVDSLDDVARGARRAASVFPIPRVQRELSETLFRLSKAAGALRVVVLDGASPVLFGDSHDEQARLDVDDALHAVRLSCRVSSVPKEVVTLLEKTDSDLEHDGQVLSEREWRQLRMMAEPPGDVPLSSQFQLVHAIAQLRQNAPDEDRVCVLDAPVPYLARKFASIYWTLLVFDERFSEVVADGHLVKALDDIERLVISLPPLDPDDPAKSRRFKRV